MRSIRVAWHRAIAFVLAIGASLFAPCAQAAITCTSVNSSGFTTAFTGTVPPINVTAASFTVTCNRNLAGDATTVNYTVGANNGLNVGGGWNRAALGGTLLQYDVYKDAACLTKWKAGGAARISDSMTLSGFAASSKTTNYWGCILNSQSVPAGTYTDTVTMTLNWGAGTLTNTFPVAIATPATCSIGTAPGSMNFNYTAFGSAQTASTSFQATCTVYLPYTLSLSSTVAVATGLNYTLALGTSASGGSSTLTSTGIGAAQTFFINGDMAAGQAGTCASGTCSATNIHTLTLTY